METRKSELCTQESEGQDSTSCSQPDPGNSSWLSPAPQSTLHWVPPALLSTQGSSHPPSAQWTFTLCAKPWRIPCHSYSPR